MKKFRSDYWPRIKEFEIVKETQQQIVYLDERGKEQREGKESQWHKWHETKEDAREYLTSVTNRKIETAKLQIVKYEKELSTIAAL